MFVLGILLVSVFTTGCLGRQTVIQNTNTEVNRNEVIQTNQQNGEAEVLAFLYQTVGLFENGAGVNTVELGQSADGVEVDSLEQSAVEWTIGKNNTDAYGDPVFSRLSNGNWAMTAWTSRDDSRGPGRLLYYEASCPTVEDDEVIAIAPSTKQGCQPSTSLTGGKTSQIFEASGGNYVFHMIFGEIYLAHLSDEDHSAMELESLCVLDTPVSSLDELEYGESTRIISQDTVDLLMSDTAMGRRADGTWVLFVKGIPSDNGCEPNTVCELCSRSVYRTTSTDLIHWTDLEEVVQQASVPEATTVDGTVWLYWQDFSDVCTAQDTKLGAIAPISAAYELAGTFALSDKQTVSFPDEEFETNKQMHYATNANPVALPDSAAVAAFAACIE